MLYASKADIEKKYGTEITTMVVDHGVDAVQTAEDNLNDATAAGQPQQNIDDLNAIYQTAQTDLQTNADETIVRNLEDASSFIDGYIKRRYPQTWVTVPDLLRLLNVDIAVYYMSLSSDWRTDEMAERYKQSLASLKSIQNGELDLTGGVAEDTTEETEAVATGAMRIGSWNRK